MEWTSYIWWNDDWFILEQQACLDFYNVDTATIKLEIRTYNVCSADTGIMELESELLAFRLAR